MQPWRLRRPAAGSHLIPINSNQNRRSKQNRYPNHTHRHSGNHRLAMASEVVVTLCVPHCRAVGARLPPQLACVEGKGQAKRHVRCNGQKINKYMLANLKNNLPPKQLWKQKTILEVLKVAVHHLHNQLFQNIIFWHSTSLPAMSM